MGAVLDKMALTGESKPTVIEHLEGRYKHVLNVIAKHFCGVTDVATTKIIELGDSSMVLRHWDSSDRWAEGNISFQNAAGDALVATTAEDLRRILVGMARVASAATGDELALPPAILINYRETPKVPEAQCLNELIDMGRLECLNQDDEHPLAHALGSSPPDADGMTEAALQSDPDVDSQLLIKLSFLQPVKLKAITLRGSVDDESAPKVMKIFLGQMNLDFQEADELAAVQTFDLAPEHVKAGDPMMLRFVKFQHVTTLQIFVQENFGADATRIEQLEFWGTPVESVDMKAWKPLSNAFSDPVNPVVEPLHSEPL